VIWLDGPAGKLHADYTGFLPSSERMWCLYFLTNASPEPLRTPPPAGP